MTNPSGYAIALSAAKIEAGRTVRQHRYPALDPPSVDHYRKGDPW